MDGSWDVKFFEINPPQFTVDSRRNWLEVLLHRTDAPTPVRDQVDQQPADQVWFAAIWLELWRNPTVELIDQYIEAVTALFANQAPVKLNQRRMARSGKRADIDEIGEVVYWRRIRQNLVAAR